MKSLLVLVCCLAVASATYAAQGDNPKKKQAAAQQGKQEAKPAKQAKQGAKAQRQTSKAQFRGQGSGQGGSQATKRKFATEGELPAVQSNKQLKKQQKFATEGEVPAVQSNKQLKKQERLEQKGEKLDAQGGLSAKQFRKQERREARQIKLAQQDTRNVTKVTFKQGRHIEGSQNWHGDNYVAFRNYRCEWHDRDWWHSHHNRIILISGGWYFWNAGFWRPAWGYDPGAYYPYDGPIYAYNDLPPDQVIANVQAELQAQGYYQGEVDGLLGPLTRAALANYQRDRGLYITSAIDQPTMESLGFAS